MLGRFLALTLFAAGAFGQSVEGSVFDASTGNGIAGVKVELLRSTTPFYETSTDGGGRFRFDRIPAGDYSIRYQSPDYWLTAGPTDYRPFPVGGEPVKLTIRMMPWSKISGRVVDDRGKAVPNARVELSGNGMVANGRTYLRTSWGGGGGGALAEAPLSMFHTGKTDVRGRFAAQVMPGPYGLCAYPPANLKPPVPEPAGPALAWMPTCYPGVGAAEAASKLLVLPGGEVSDIELKLAAAPTHTVRGIVLNPDETPASGVVVNRVQSEPFPVKTGDDGTFEIPSLTEGAWGLVADDQRGARKLRASAWIEVSKHDLEGVKLRLAPPVAVRVKVMLEGPETPVPTPKFGAIILAEGGMRSQVQLAPGLVDPIQTDPGAPPQNVFPGVYRLFPMMQALTPPYYLDAVRVGDVNLMERDAEIAFDTEMTIVYRTDAGSVSGKAANCSLGGVLLVPRDRGFRRPGSTKSGPCDGNDRYQIQGVRPGEYYALALAGNGPQPRVDDALLNQATRVTVRAGMTSTADLKTVTQPIF